MTAAIDWREWAAKGDNDLLSIDNNLRSAEVPWDTICFHAQQAAEKYLKGFLVAKGVVPPKVHELIAILTQCAQHDSSLGSLAQDCRALEQYAVVSRYPEGQIPPENKCRDLAHAARRVKAEVLSRLT